MNTKKIIATIITFVVAVMILVLAFAIYGMLTASEEETNPKTETITDGEERSSPPASISPTTAKELPEVEISIVKNEALESGFSVQGRLRAYDKAEIVSEVPGMMKTSDKRFKLGTRYSKGELMIDIDDTEPRIALKAQKAQLQTAITAMLPDFKIDMPDSYNQWKSYVDAFDIASPVRTFPKPISDREEYYVSSKGIHSQYYNIKNAEVRLNKYRVLAPFDGILTQANVNEGSYVRAGASLGMIMNTYAYEMEAAVPVADLKYIRRGLSVKVVSDDSGKTWFGKVKRVSDLVDATTQTAIVYIGLSGNGLREGQYLRAIINTPSSNKGMKISKDLLVDNTKVHVVEDGQLKAKTIQVLSMEDNDVIVKGLENGEQILAKPIAGAHEGMKVALAK